MLSLFTRVARACVIVCAVYVALALGIFFISGTLNLLLFSLLILIGLIFILARFNRYANRKHERLLGRLYNELDVTGFLREYEPFLQKKLRDAELYLLIRLHLSNAYCALGRFDDATKLLESVDVRAKKPEQAAIARFSVLSNLCYSYELQGDIPKSEETLGRLREAQRELEALQESKPENRRMFYSTATNEECLHVLKGEPADIDALKEQARLNQGRVLSSLTALLWVARALLAADRRREAVELFEQIARLAPHLYPGKSAKAALDALTGDKNGALF